MRWTFGLFAFALSLPLWFFSLLADPYTSWGIEVEKLRPGVGELSGLLAVIALIFVFGAALSVFWADENRRGWKALAFGLPLLFVGGTMIARLVWLRFWVFGS